MADKKLKVELAVIDQATKELKNIGGAFNGLQNQIMAFGKAATGIFAGGIVVRQFERLAQAGIDLGDRISDTSAKLGISTKSFQEWDYVTKQMGGNIEGLSRAFKGISTEAYKGNKAFEVLGISTKETNGEFRETGELFKDTVLKLAAIDNSTVRTAATQKIFGKGATEVLAIIGRGPEAIRELIDETDRYGLILSDKMVKSLDSAKDAQLRLNLSWTIAEAKLTSLLGPVVEYYARVLAGENIFGAARQIQVERTIELAKAEKDVNVIFNARGEILKEIANEELKPHSNQKKIEELQRYSRQYAAAMGSMNASPSGIGDLDPDKTAREKDASQKKAEVAARKSISEQKRIDDQFRKYVSDAADEGYKDLEAQGKIKEEQEKKELDFDDQMKEAHLQIDRELAESRAEIDEAELNRKEQVAQREVYIKNNLINATMTSNSAIASLERLAIQNSKSSAREKKNLLIAVAIMEEAAAAVTAIQAGWDEGSKVSPWLGAVDAVAAGLSAVATFASEIASIEGASFARGGSFTTNGPRAIIVGDNPGGRERVDITPQSSKNFNGPQGTTANFHFYNSSGMEVETFRAKINSGEMDSVMTLLKQKMELR
jgi:hypothetical protein